MFSGFHSKALAQASRSIEVYEPEIEMHVGFCNFRFGLMRIFSCDFRFFRT